MGANLTSACLGEGHPRGHNVEQAIVPSITTREDLMFGEACTVAAGGTYREVFATGKTYVLTITADDNKASRNSTDEADFLRLACKSEARVVERLAHVEATSMNLRRVLMQLSVRINAGDSLVIAYTGQRETVAGKSAFCLPDGSGSTTSHAGWLLDIDLAMFLTTQFGHKARVFFLLDTWGSAGALELHSPSWAGLLAAQVAMGRLSPSICKKFNQHDDFGLVPLLMASTELLRLEGELDYPMSRLHGAMMDLAGDRKELLVETVPAASTETMMWPLSPCGRAYRGPPLEKVFKQQASTFIDHRGQQQTIGAGLMTPVPPTRTPSESSGSQVIPSDFSSISTSPAPSLCRKPRLSAPAAYQEHARDAVHSLRHASRRQRQVSPDCESLGPGETESRHRCRSPGGVGNGIGSFGGQREIGNESTCATATRSLSRRRAERRYAQSISASDKASKRGSTPGGDARKSADVDEEAPPSEGHTCNDSFRSCKGSKVSLDDAAPSVAPPLAAMEKQTLGGAPDASTGATGRQAICPAGHGLEAFRSPEDGYCCSRCSRSMPAGTLLYGCRPCDFDVCEVCHQTQLRHEPEGEAEVDAKVTVKCLSTITEEAQHARGLPRLLGQGRATVDDKVAKDSAAKTQKNSLEGESDPDRLEVEVPPVREKPRLQLRQETERRRSPTPPSLRGDYYDDDDDEEILADGELQRLRQELLQEREQRQQDLQALLRAQVEPQLQQQQAQQEQHKELQKQMQQLQAQLLELQALQQQQQRSSPGSEQSGSRRAGLATTASGSPAEQARRTVRTPRSVVSEARSARDRLHRRRQPNLPTLRFGQQAEPLSRGSSVIGHRNNSASRTALPPSFNSGSLSARSGRSLGSDLTPGLTTTASASVSGGSGDLAHSIPAPWVPGSAKAKAAGGSEGSVEAAAGSGDVTPNFANMPHAGPAPRGGQSGA